MPGLVSLPVTVAFPFRVPSPSAAPQLGIVPAVRVYLIFEIFRVASMSLGDAVVLFVAVMEPRPACSFHKPALG